MQTLIETDYLDANAGLQQNFNLGGEQNPLTLGQNAVYAPQSAQTSTSTLPPWAIIAALALVLLIRK